MKIALFLNPIKDTSFEYTNKVISTLYSSDITVFMDKKYSSALNNKCISFYDDASKMVDDCDMILTIGGDGTIIHYAKYAAGFSKPILGINLGRLGFVTGLENNELYKLELLSQKKYKIEQRTMLKVTVDEKLQKTFFALNDAVISRGELSKIVDFSVYLGENEVCSYRADGLICSTSTGSTAYSLSAGGPIIDPMLNCVLLTPICSHSMFARPIVFSGTVPIFISAKSRDNNSVLLNIDGNNILDISNCDKIKIECSNKKLDIVTFDDRSFYRRLSEKLSGRMS